MGKAAFVLAIGLFLVDPAFALDQAVVKDVRGRVVVGEAEGRWRPARVGMRIPVGTYISTGLRASAVIDLGASELLVKELTRIKLEELVEREGTVSTKLFLRVGRIGARVKPLAGLETDFTLRGPFATVEVTGTEFEFDGISVETADGSATIINRVGQKRSATTGEKISAPGFLLPTSAQQLREARATAVVDTSRPMPGEGGSGGGSTALISTPPKATTTNVVITLDLP